MLEGIMWLLIIVYVNLLLVINLASEFLEPSTYVNEPHDFEGFHGEMMYV